MSCVWKEEAAEFCKGLNWQALEGCIDWLLRSGISQAELGASKVESGLFDSTSGLTFPPHICSWLPLHPSALVLASNSSQLKQPWHLIGRLPAGSAGGAPRGEQPLVMSP